MQSLTRRRFLGRALIAGAALGAVPARAQTPAPAQPPTPAGKPSAKLIEDLVAANRILVDQGVLDGYGHVSVRDDRDPQRYWMARSVAPESVVEADLLEHDLDGNVPGAPEGTTLYLERFIHGEIYRARPDVHSVVHSHSPSIIPFGVSRVPLRPLYHMSAFLGGGAPVFDIRAVAGETDMLVRTPELGRALARALGPHAVVLMRGHGAVIVGPDLPLAVFRSVYTEVNARLQAQAQALGRTVTFLDAAEARMAEATMAKTVSRPWALWRRKALGNAAR